MANSYEAFNFNIRGLDEIERRLKNLPEKLRKRKIRKIFKKAGQIPLEAARRRAPKRAPAVGWEAFVEYDDNDKHLKDGIVLKVGVGIRESFFRVGVNYEDIRHGHLVEFGTDPHKEANFIHPGAKAQPFMRPAFDETADRTTNQVINDLAQAVEEVF